jgi:hypothetical protein
MPCIGPGTTYFGKLLDIGLKWLNQYDCEGRVPMVAIHFGTMHYTYTMDKRNLLHLVIVPN